MWTTRYGAVVMALVTGSERRKGGRIGHPNLTAGKTPARPQQRVKHQRPQQQVNYAKLMSRSPHPNDELNPRLVGMRSEPDILKARIEHHMGW